MADTIVATVGEALGAMYSGISGAGAVMQAGTFAVVWVNPLTSDGPGFRWTYNREISPHILVGANYVVLTPPSQPVPIGWVCGVGGPNRQTPINSGALEYDVSDMVMVIGDAVKAMFEDLCGADVSGPEYNEATIDGKTKPIAAAATMMVQQGRDVKMWEVVLIDFSIEANIAAPQLNPTVILGSTTASIQQYSLVAPAQDQLPFDLDVAINNGANIYSVISKTFTEPGT